MKVVVLLLISVLAVFASDLITNLPGAPAVTFSQYAGYIEVDASTDKNLFYWFTESQRSPTFDGLVLWLNGGPGSSGLVGLFQELGPFKPNSDGVTLQANPYSWNTIANIIFLDAPAGTGFSYSNTTFQNDTTTAIDIYAFLQQFFARYPHFLNNEFWLAGEGYAAHILPKVATYITTGSLAINFQGVILGNPFASITVNNYAEVVFANNINLVDYNLYNAIIETCDLLNVEIFSPACHNLIAQFNYLINDINYFSPYEDVCLNSDSYPDKKRSIPANTRSVVPRSTARYNPPCIDNYLIEYLNQEDVIAAIHANPNIEWTPQGNPVYDGFEEERSVLPLILEQIQNNIPYLIYSGDLDFYVPTFGTRYFIGQFNLTTVLPWHEWTDSANQVGGYAQFYTYSGYGGLQFLTVKGADHYVPASQPRRSLSFITKYLEQVPI